MKKTETTDDRELEYLDLMAGEFADALASEALKNFDLNVDGAGGSDEGGNGFHWDYVTDQGKISVLVTDSSGRYLTPATITQNAVDAYAAAKAWNDEVSA